MRESQAAWDSTEIIYTIRFFFSVFPYWLAVILKSSDHGLSFPFSYSREIVASAKWLWKSYPTADVGTKDFSNSSAYPEDCSIQHTALLLWYQGCPKAPVHLHPCLAKAKEKDQTSPEHVLCLSYLKDGLGLSRGTAWEKQLGAGGRGINKQNPPLPPQAPPPLCF